MCFCSHFLRKSGFDREEYILTGVYVYDTLQNIDNYQCEVKENEYNRYRSYL